MNHIGAVVLLLAWLVAPACGGEPARATKRKPSFTIGKDTTYITGPLDADGYPDYAAALNERLRKGVTPTNNANVLLWQAFGPHPEGATMPAEFFQWLGMPPPPEKGDYFISIDQFAKKQGLQVQVFGDAVDRAGQRPWTAKDYPDVTAWLQANVKPLAVVAAATERPEYYSPLTPVRTKEGGPGGLMNSLVPGVQVCRDLARALDARAMLALGERRDDDAWRDLLASHRLGRLVARGGTLIEALVGIAIEQYATAAELAYLEGAKLSARQIQRRARTLQRLPPMPLIADKIDLTERFTFLEIVTLVDRYGPQYLEQMGSGKPAGPPSFLTRVAMANVNWDPALRNGNRWFDRFTAAMRIDDHAERAEKLYQLEVEVKTLKQNIMDKTNLLKLFLGLGNGPQMRGKAIGDVLITLLLPALRKVDEAGERTKQIERNRTVAFALAAYRSDHGHYPKELAALAPDYLPRVPLDLFTGKEIAYRPSGNSYLLYSFGVNGRDDRGQTYGDDPYGDDLPIRMPLPALPPR